MKISNKTRFLLLCLLVILNFVIRIPSIPHESGLDSFIIHILANSLSENGYAKWYINSLSFFGAYPYSEASAIPFALSGVSQLTGLEMESVIWLYSLVIGLFSAFTAYLLAGFIQDDDIFRFLVAFGYSLSPGVLAFTTWNLSMRGPFIVTLPLFIYILIKIHNFRIRCSILAFILFILLAATHHLVYFILPIILIFIILSFMYNKNMYAKIKIMYNIINVNLIFDKLKITRLLVNVGFIIAFLTMFAIPFITGMFIDKSRYIQLNEIISDNVRYTGFLLIFVPGGFVYLALKNQKKFGELFLLLLLIVFAPLMWIPVYGYWIIILLSCLLIGVSLTNLMTKIKNVKLVNICIIIILLFAVGMSAFYQHWRTKQNSGEWFVDERTYIGALWIKQNVDKNKNMVSNDEIYDKRMLAFSEVPTLVDNADAPMYIYGFEKLNGTPIVANSPFSFDFYRDNPYMIAYNYTRAGYVRNFLQLYNVESTDAKSVIMRFNLSYAIENTNFNNAFYQSLQKKNENLYDNGKIRIWNLNESNDKV